MLAARQPYVLDIIVPYTEHVLPMIPGGMTYKDIITQRVAGSANRDANRHLPTAL
jgi:acetolactate synthase-1/2/3 large subunit